ncbi:hypothetical protein F8388_005409 [Cannabis sativa]|uniref:Uncharacterized protein n=1 Tax=Cannabis sativa TaxID=3483 RepID=A0A7J6H8Q5_CANSA|nr:hypothetical protein F8388_005409 [Cannabis sativa]
MSCKLLKCERTISQNVDNHRKPTRKRNVLSAVILQPLGDKGIAIVGGDTIRGFTTSDQAWISLIAEKLDATLAKCFDNVAFSLLDQVPAYLAGSTPCFEFVREEERDLNSQGNEPVAGSAKYAKTKSLNPVSQTSQNCRFQLGGSMAAVPKPGTFRYLYPSLSLKWCTTLRRVTSSNSGRTIDLCLSGLWSRQVYPTVTPFGGGELNPDGPKLWQVVLISAIEVDEEKLATSSPSEF